MRPETASMWRSLWIRQGGNPREWRQALGVLQKRYAEPHRAYHTLGHIEFCLRTFKQIQWTCESDDAVRMAIWFHDVIYDPHRHDNELRSADLARELLAFNPRLAQYVSSLVLLTNHVIEPSTEDGKVLLDIDLSILAADEITFRRYEKQIHEEYHFVPEDAYRVGRCDILARFLDRPFIYYTEIGQRLYERRARENLKVLIKSLS